jgi:hypothetical protein
LRIPVTAASQVINGRGKLVKRVQFKIGRSTIKIDRTQGGATRKRA